MTELPSRSMGIESVAEGGSRGSASALEGLGAVVEGIGKGAVVLGAFCREGIARIRLAYSGRSRSNASLNSQSRGVVGRL